ncbi:Hypothetical protein UVM_LOCUS357 [uncultured virus]|nr:Hypothetical protein UVM_LOCUS357 [uncultured virus]
MMTSLVLPELLLPSFEAERFGASEEELVRRQPEPQRTCSCVLRKRRSVQLCAMPRSLQVLAARMSRGQSVENARERLGLVRRTLRRFFAHHAIGLSATNDEHESTVFSCKTTAQTSKQIASTANRKRSRAGSRRLTPFSVSNSDPTTWHVCVQLTALGTTRSGAGVSSTWKEDHRAFVAALEHTLASWLTTRLNTNDAADEASCWPVDGNVVDRRRPAGFLCRIVVRSKCDAATTE